MVRILPVFMAVRKWNRLTVGPGERWVDLGSGNAESLVRIASRQAGSVIGCDLASSVELAEGIRKWGSAFPDGLRPNVRYHVLKGGDDIIDVVGRHSARVVSLLFPPRVLSPLEVLIDDLTDDHAAPRDGRDDYEALLQTQVALLQAGGLGIVVTESTFNLLCAVRLLRRQQEVERVAMTAGRAAVARLGIAPYTLPGRGPLTKAHLIFFSKVMHNS